KPVYRLTTQLGRTIRATGNHKFLTIHGWKRLDELSAGTHLALPRELRHTGTTTLSHAELGLLGHLIGDGCALPRHALQYTTRELDLAETVQALAYEVFGNALTVRIAAELQWYQVYLSATENLARSRRNPIAQWLDELGVFGLRSHEKRVPHAVFMQPDGGTACFLRHLWSTDGCVRMRWGKKPQPAVYYATSSRDLAYDVQSLLLRLQINARVRLVAQGAKGRNQYHVIVSGTHDLRRFAEKIGAVGAYKQSSLQEILDWMDGRTANTNRDIVPKDVWRLHVAPTMAEAGMSTRVMQRELGMQYCGTTLYQSHLSRERTQRVADVVDSDELRQLAESDVYWDRVVSIEPDGEEAVYDLTVPGHHNFVAGDIIVHNSIEQDADVVLFIYREDYYVPDTDRQNVADVIVAKHRHGSTGSVALYFKKELTQFRDLELKKTELDY
ncbi:MAG: hypothetical protein KDD83_22875, partial [Caldilineaceae bacterium]|nr:hypothetical protein [Caldilineaceae bacterium]